MNQKIYIKDVPDTLHLSDLYDGEGDKRDVNLTVHVLRANGTHDIIDQYVQFCQITDEQRKKYGYTKKAIEETIRLSIEHISFVFTLVHNRITQK